MFFQYLDVPGTELSPEALIRNRMTKLCALGAHRQVCGVGGWGRHVSNSYSTVQFSSVQFSCSVVSNSLQPHEPQHARPPCPSPTAGVHPNPCPLCQWCHPTISSSVVPSSSCPQSFPASGSFQMSQLSASGGQSIGVSASTSVLPMNT